MKFKKEITVNGIRKEFHFQRIEKDAEDIFLVSYQDDDGMPHAFTMGKDESDSWKVLPQVVPQWTAVEALQVSEMLDDHISNNESSRGVLFNPWDILGT